jgi:hypothetical protein
VDHDFDTGADICPLFTPLKPPSDDG